MSHAVMPTYNRAPLRFVSGQGAWLTDESGERYLDFGAGIAVNALGHAHPYLVEALREQAGRLWHTSNLYELPGQEALARRLTEVTFADTAFFLQFRRGSGGGIHQAGPKIPLASRAAGAMADHHDRGLLPRADTGNHCRGRRPETRGRVRTDARRFRLGAVRRSPVRSRPRSARKPQP